MAEEGPRKSQDGGARLARNARLHGVEALRQHDHAARHHVILRTAGRVTARAAPTTRAA